MHAWEIDPAEEPPQADPTLLEQPRAPSARSTPPRKLARESDRRSPIETPDPGQDLQSRRAASSAPFRRIAMCVDGSEMSDTIVRHATMVALAFGAPLTILRVIETESNEGTAPPDPLDWGVRQREARSSLDRLVSVARHRGIDVRTELLQGRAAERICSWTLQHDVDLTVLGSHGEHGRSAWTISSTARKLVDGVPGSLLLVPADGDRREGSAGGYRRIMVPLDGSARAESVLPAATRLAMAHEADLLIAHVPPVPELTRAGPLTAEDLELEQRVIARNERVARCYFDQIRARVSEAGLAARTIISRGGDPRTRLARLVRREGVDLVILSAYGRRGPRDTPCGSVAAHLLARVAVPLLVFRERPRRVTERLSQEAARRAVSARSPAQAAP
jgi:nucleotide-binding universal stress UspA family protein